MGWGAWKDRAMKMNMRLSGLVSTSLSRIVTAIPTRRRRGAERASIVADAAPLLPLALLAACGGGGGGVTPIPAPTPTPTPTPTPVITGVSDSASIGVLSPPVTGDVLTNDLRANTTAELVVTAVAAQGGAAGTVGQPLAGTFGTLTVGAEGSFSYAVANNAATRALGLNQTATDVFTYTPSAGGVAGAATTISFTVNGVNDAPTATADTLAYAAGSGAISGSLTANDVDPDAGTTLTVTSFALQGGAAVAAGQTVVGEYGSLTVQANGQYTYTPSPTSPARTLPDGRTAAEIFTYTVSDGAGGTSSATLVATVTGVGDAPTAVADAVTLTAYGPGATGNVLANDTDPDQGTVLSVVQLSEGPLGQRVNGSFGTVVLEANGAYSYTQSSAATALAPGASGVDRFTYVMTDGTGKISSTTLTFTVTGNNAPVAVADSITVTENAPAVSIPVLTNDTDVDAGDTKTLVGVNSVTVTSSNGAVNGINASGAVLANNAPNLISFTAGNRFDALNPGETASVVVNYTMRDRGGATSSANLTITVTGQTDMFGNLNLGALGTAGFAVSAPAGATGFGLALAGGNIDSDTPAELVVGAPNSGSGAAYIYSITNAGATLDRTLTGQTAGDRFGFDVGVGNLGGSTAADVLVGAPSVSNNTGASYIFYGGGTANTPAGLDGGTTTGFAVTTAALGGTAAYPTAAVNVGGSLGAAVAVLGSVNGDARNDFFVAAPGADSGTPGVTDRGTSAVGFTAATPGNTTLQALQSVGNGLGLVSNDTTDDFGFLSAAAGNINGTGGIDLAVGYPNRDNNGGAATPQGAVFVALGDINGGGNTDFAGLNGANGFRVVTPELNARLGQSVAVGDLTGDGRAEIIVGAPGANGGNGAVYIITGAIAYGAAEYDVSTFQQNGQVRIFTIQGQGGFGSSVSYLGDFNGDGLGDFAVGAPNEGANGNAYILFGTSSLTGASYTNTHYNAVTPNANVIRLTGAVTGTGTEVAGPGDLDGDGLADAVIGATGGSGMAYVVFGRGGQSGNFFAKEPLSVEGLFDDDSTVFDGSSPAPFHAQIEPAVHLLPDDLAVLPFNG